MSTSRPAYTGLASIIYAKRFDTTNFRLYVFQPEESFYFLPFKRRLKLLEKSIEQAHDWFKKAELPTTAKALFVAPEYLFKNFSKEAADRYYSQDEKKLYVHKLSKLSEKTDLVIIPGTICWSKLGNKEQQTQRFFRNTAYFFHRGQREKYKKTCLAASDQDHNLECTIKKNVFITGSNDSPIKRINGLTIGIEICLDNAFNIVEKGCAVEKIHYKSLDIHLVLANTLRKTTLPTTSRPLFVKIDQRPGYTFGSKKYSNLIGRTHSTFTAANCNTEQNDLFCYEFNDTTQAIKKTGKLPEKFELPYSSYIERLKKQSLSAGIKKFPPTVIEKLFLNFSINSQQENTFEMDFPQYILALNTADLLTENNAEALFSMSAFACEYTVSLLELKNAGLLTPETNAFLNKNVSKTIILKNLFLKLHYSGHLTSEMLRPSLQRAAPLRDYDRSILREVYVLFSELIEINFFQTSYLFDMLKGIPQLHLLFPALKAVVALTENDLFNAHRAQVLLTNKKHKKSHHYVQALCNLKRLSEATPNLPTDLIEAVIEENIPLAKWINAILELTQQHLPTFTKFVDLFNHVEHFPTLLDIIEKLSALNFFTNDNLDNFVIFLNTYRTQLTSIFNLVLELSELQEKYKRIHQPDSLFTPTHNAITAPSFVVQRHACEKLIKLIFSQFSEDFSDDEKIALTTPALRKITKKHADTLKLLKMDITTYQDNMERRLTV